MQYQKRKSMAKVMCAVLVMSMLLLSPGPMVIAGGIPNEDAKRAELLAQITQLQQLILLLQKQLELQQAQEAISGKGMTDAVTTSNPVVTLQTNFGAIEIELYEDVMPITAGNFKQLVAEGFYDGIKFHRVIDGFMIQGGDPISKTDEVMRYGTGGPGYTIPDEFVADEKLTNVRGTISMANAGPETGGSQFFINLVNNVNLDFDKSPTMSKHPVFGKVISGMEVVDVIGSVETTVNDLPIEPVVIESATLIE
jgi:peptidylprolyl isomerase